MIQRRFHFSCWRVFEAFMILLLIAVFCLALPACDSGGRGAADAQANAGGPPRYPFRVTTTVGMITDIVRQVAGEKAKVIGIIGEAVDPHLYRPGTNDVALLMSADVVFYSGLLLEGKMADTLVNVASSVHHVHQVTRLIDEKYLLEPEAFGGHPDPHVWMDVQAWMKAVEVVAQKLSAYDPTNSVMYEANSRAYTAELEKLDRYAKQAIATIPKAQRIMITAHDAFNYFGRAYDVEVLGIQGLSTESEAGLERINRLVDLIVERDVKAVFVESSVPDKYIRALIEGADHRGRQVSKGGTLFSDAMGPPGTYEGTYLGMIDHNVTTVARALGGEAPQRGMQGKLTLILEHKVE
jgi:manganese/zinc/iron transport system substrate-binding protein